MSLIANTANNVRGSIDSWFMRTLLTLSPRLMQSYYLYRLKNKMYQFMPELKAVSYPRKNLFLEKGPLLFLVFVYSFIFIFILNYNNMWVHPEAFHWKFYILENGSCFGFTDFLKAFNWQVFEYLPRINRPLSSLFEIIDTKFRSFLWNFLIPHPTFSLTFLFSLFFSPYLIYRILKNFGVDRNISICISALYLSNPGLLSLISMSFRPSKAIANFFIILCLFLGSNLYIKCTDNNKAFPTTDYLFLLFVMFFSFFCDETALISYLAVFLIFPKIVFNSFKSLFLYLLLPFLYFCFCSYFIPLFTKYIGFLFPSISAYNPYVFFTSLRGVNIFLNNFSFYDFFQTSSLLFLDTFGLINPFFTRSPFYYLLFVLNSLLVIFLSWKIAKRIFLNHTISNWPGDRNIIFRFLVFLIILTIFSYVLILSIGVKMWGIYYYNSYWPIFLYIMGGLILRSINYNKSYLIIHAIIISISCFYVFTYTNLTFKAHHYYVPYYFEKVFKNEINRFNVSMPEMNLYQKTIDIWKHRKDNIAFKNIPVELFYLIPELKITKSSISDAKKVGEIIFEKVVSNNRFKMTYSKETYQYNISFYNEGKGRK